MFHELIEATLGQLNVKQKSITRLFPDFFSNPVKVKGVISKGGVRLSSIEKDKWTFTVHSGTEEGLWYDVVVRWKDVEKDVQKLVLDRRNWTKDKKRANLKKIATKLFKDGNVELSCECPAQTYYGGDYILTQRSAKHGESEDRPPVVRNPKEYGAYCKHIQVLMRTLPFYKTTIANWLGKEFKDLIQKSEAGATQTAQQYKVAGQALGQRKGIRKGKTKESRLNEAVAILPEPQQVLLDELGEATDEQWMQKSTYPGEESYVKFWLLSDGSLVHVPVIHAATAKKAVDDLDELIDSGAARVLVNSKYLGVDTPEQGFTREQRTALADLYNYYQSEELALEGEGQFPIKSSDHLRRLLGESIEEDEND